MKTLENQAEIEIMQLGCRTQSWVLFKMPDTVGQRPPETAKVHILHSRVTNEERDGVAALVRPKQLGGGVQLGAGGITGQHALFPRQKPGGGRGIFIRA